MALTSSNSVISSKSLLQSPLPSLNLNQTSISAIPIIPKSRSIKINPISVVHAAESTKSTTPNVPTTTIPTKSSTKWTIDSWRSIKALQLPECPDHKELELVLQTLKAFPPIVFVGEARKLEDRLAGAAMGNAFSHRGVIVLRALRS
ncbi:hypothetical protein GIB67_037917 [Kingdonia uniflora]|uniref:Phospho-2-dehydro-3-deoxyheptonate aldolase n=1 Tax=Kingdonia uniflora TaxID=39325 RepID=A0A7J7LHD4_9MAGN|nr:hypothetical protein GIB67_037917 [Kingdonia uniflora]